MPTPFPEGSYIKPTGNASYISTPTVSTPANPVPAVAPANTTSPTTTVTTPTNLPSIDVNLWNTYKKNILSTGYPIMMSTMTKPDYLNYIDPTGKTLLDYAQQSPTWSSKWIELLKQVGGKTASQLTTGS
jgi:hypothetical protein